ncbi:hypothetical protein CDAR_395811 [Caerostris darwini]|uniref:Uncharacterized protein n=1 Tax=Caerostris darwini TaxID=1538125 RepID=A0AAV4QQ14_9ARAC|nr:hypothetical protein CDAR_395811 [Caerostris darwini]
MPAFPIRQRTSSRRGETNISKCAVPQLISILAEKLSPPPPQTAISADDPAPTSKQTEVVYGPALCRGGRQHPIRGIGAIDSAPPLIAPLSTFFTFGPTPKGSTRPLSTAPRTVGV